MMNGFNYTSCFCFHKILHYTFVPNSRGVEIANLGEKISSSFNNYWRMTKK